MSAPMPLPPAPPPRAEWATRPERSSMFWLRVMTWISLRLGRPAARLVLHLIAAYFLAFSPAARRASRNYLARVLDRPPRLGDLYRHFHTFATTIHDRVYLINDRFDLFDLEIVGEDIIQDIGAHGRGAFLMGGHLGSFEAVRALGRRYPRLDFATLMYEDNARKINAMLSAINPRVQHNLIPLGRLDSMLKVREGLDAGMVVGILADRSLDAGACVELPFLGGTAAFPLGPFRMAAMLRRPVVFMAGLHTGGNRYHIHFELIADFSDTPAGGRDAAVRAALARYAACLEAQCRRAPYNWFNFFDFWQPRDTPAAP